ncbi:hypothetical protein ACTI_03430 [Actinoplanes sp. OR16]|uniref:hypothetical protein n=1 Tax=Actinoplanes sp. OR16 TaxID=946334 RepID=UPI000F6DF196|nr:hypothetical protein [Actinoplanes sp. OR16]BBH63658.1 hypothetical protein ACTI_03430 [Actinoplanes sp. OR16]
MTQPRTRRSRALWIVFAVAGAAGVAGWWLAPVLLGGAQGFLGLSLGDKDSVASVVSMVTGLISLAVSVWFGLSQGRRPPSAGELTRPAKNLPLIDDPATSALALRVHAASDVVPAADQARARRWWPFRRPPAGPDPRLPVFVERDQGEHVREWLRRARTDGGFLILVGNSCVGKTRLLYESTRTELAGFRVLAPALGDGAAVNRAAAVEGGLLVWLDELQRFLPGPYLSEGSEPITASAIEALLDSPHPVVVVGTLWPDHATALRSTEPGEPDDRRPRFPAALDILTGHRVHQIRLDTFSAAERENANRLAPADDRLATALADRDYNVTEALAGAREIVARYQRATDDERAVLYAAADARRAGVQSPLTPELLAAAARGYLTHLRPDDSWFPAALAELSSRDRRQDKATAPLLQLTSDDRRTSLGYTMTDYLLQRLTRERRTLPLPPATWQALAEHAPEDDLAGLAESAELRLRFTEAIRFYERLEALGNPDATEALAVLRLDDGVVERLSEQTGDFGVSHELPTVLIRLGRLDDLRSLAAGGDHAVSYRLAAVLVADVDLGALTRRADDGDSGAASSLATLLSDRGDLGTLTERADAGDFFAADRLADLLAYRGDVDRLRDRADRGDRVAGRRLATLLFHRDDLAAIRSRAETGDEEAARTLREILADRGEPVGDPGADPGDPPMDLLLHDDPTFASLSLAELRKRADGSGVHISYALAAALGDLGDVAELAERAAAGDSMASYHLAAVLADRDDIAELNRRADSGDFACRARLAELRSRRSAAEPAGLRDRADAGDGEAQQDLAAWLSDRGSLAELAGRAGSGDWFAGTRLAQLLTRRGHSAEVRRRAGDGDQAAQAHLVRLLTLREDLAGLAEHAGAGDTAAQFQLLRVFVRQENDEGIAARADSGDDVAAAVLAERWLARGLVDEVSARADRGDLTAADRLVRHLAEHGRHDVLAQRADAGDFQAATVLADLLARQGRREDLVARADAGDLIARRRLASLLNRTGRIDDLARRADEGDREAVEEMNRRLADRGEFAALQARTEQGATDDFLLLDVLAVRNPGRLRELADDGDFFAAGRLVDLLAHQGRWTELIAEVHAGSYGAADRLLDLLVIRDPAGSAAIRRHGLSGGELPQGL